MPNSPLQLVLHEIDVSLGKEAYTSVILLGHKLRINGLWGGQTRNSVNWVVVEELGGVVLFVGHVEHV